MLQQVLLSLLPHQHVRLYWGVLQELVVTGVSGQVFWRSGLLPFDEGGDFVLLLVVGYRGRLLVIYEVILLSIKPHRRARMVFIVGISP